MPFVKEVRDRLAQTAHAVYTPFIDKCRNSISPEVRVYGIVARDIGEAAAAQVIFWGEEPATNNSEALKSITDIVSARYDGSYPHLINFLIDETAIVYALEVYTTCLANIEPISV
jgi:hypothetical protein